MARRRSYLERPHDHLSKAVAAHSAIVAGEQPPDELEEQPAPPAEPSAQSRRASAQRRTEGGTFA